MNISFSGYSPRPFFNTIKEILIPTLEQAIASLTIALVLFLAVSSDFIVNKVIQGDTESRHYFYQNFENFLNKISSAPHAPELSVITAWALVGCLAYIGIVLLINIVIELNIIAVISRELATEPKKAAFTIVDEYRRAIWVGIFLVVLGISIFYLLHFWFRLINLQNDINVVNIIGGIIGLAANLYIIYMLRSSVVHNPIMIRRQGDIIHK